MFDCPSLHKFQHSSEIDDYQLLKPEKRKSGHAAFSQYKLSMQDQYMEKGDEADSELDLTPVKGKSTASSSFHGERADSQGVHTPVGKVTAAKESDEESKDERVAANGFPKSSFQSGSFKSYSIFGTNS